MTGKVSHDVAALVVAGREAWEYLQEHCPHDNVTAALVKALEEFASRVCWDDEGGSIPEAHADPCTCAMSEIQRLGQEFDAGEGRCGDNGLALCQACSLPAHELTQSPGCGAPMQKHSALAFNDEKVEATQADRDMAADVLFHVDDDPFVDNIREGWEDDSYLVQAFARHRVSHPATTEPVGLREADLRAMFIEG